MVPVVTLTEAKGQLLLFSGLGFLAQKQIHLQTLQFIRQVNLGQIM